ncbi:hypothetical protein MYX82_05185 [Acidobacteria bacterium AH-259-D05]|nr:hypothetical protein [Acidobacteria bacterium AH-259-D05]
MRARKATPQPNRDIDPAEAAAVIWEASQQALTEGKPERFSDETVQQLMTAAVKLFAAKVEMEERFFSPVLQTTDVVTPTEAVVTVSEILRAVNLNPFDLAMWFNRQRSD